MTDRYLAGHTALVTSSSRNLGAEVCRAFAAAGADVITTYFNSRPEAVTLVEELRESGVHADAVPGDTRNGHGTEALVSAAIEAARGPVDVLVNNSGPFSMTPFVELPESEWNLIWDANVKAAFVASKMLAPVMRDCGWGRIVNVSAGSAYLRNHSIYTLAKDAMITLTESLAVELAPESTVNCVAPGQILESALDMAEFDPTFAERSTAATPVGRLVTRAEVAEVITELCGPRFSMVTGATVPIDGGWRLTRV